VEWMRALTFDRLDLNGLTLVGQDWGGLIGLRLVAEHPDRFARVVAANTGLPTGDQPMPDVWLRFREIVRTAPTLSVSRLVQSGCQTQLPPEVLAAYEAPFPDPAFMAAVRAMPNLVPTTPDDPASEANRAAWRRLAAWDKPFLVAFSDRDPITGSMGPILARTIPGAAGVEHPVIAGAGHFLQEDAGERFGTAIADFIRTHPAG
jgi:haloalkane dehalogenase